MPKGYTGIGLLGGGRELDIYRVSAAEVFDAATGMPVLVVSWRRQGFHTARS
jgi:hypothetical protein